MMDEREHRLWTFEIGDKEVRIEPWRLEDPSVEVHAALSLPTGGDLVATSGGLWQLDESHARLAETNLPQIPDGVRALGRDGSGRIWLGGSAVWVVDPNENRLREVSGIPLFPGAEVVAIAPNPDDPQGIIASLGDRGVLFIRFVDGESVE
jgi:hypothetical protein